MRMKHIGKVMTVNGPIDPGDLGPTLSHEHLFLPMNEVSVFQSDDPEAAAQFDRPLTAENYYLTCHDHYAVKANCTLGEEPGDFDLIVKELLLFKERGGKSLVELSGTGPEDLLRFAKVTGLNIITSTAYLRGLINTPSFRGMTREFAENSNVETIAKQFLRDIEFGYADKGVLPGIIGELHTGVYLEPHEIKVLRAAAIAQQESGLAITIHLSHVARNAHDVLDLLEEEGVPMKRVILGHIDSCMTQKDVSMHDAYDYMCSVADRGAYVEFDLCGNEGYFVRRSGSYQMPSDRDRINAIKNLVLRGHTKRILNSQDVGHRNYLVSYGGWGYGHVLGFFKKRMLSAGLQEDTIAKFTVDNPARVLTIC